MPPWLWPGPQFFEIFGRECTNVTATTVAIKPQRVCWIYYNNDAAGKLLNSTSNGFAAKTSQAWTVTPPNF